MKRAALYMRVSTLDQHPETQLYDLRQMADQRGYEISRPLLIEVPSPLPWDTLLRENPIHNT